MKQPVLYGSGGGDTGWSSVAVITAPSGAKVTVSGGGEVIKFDGTGSSYAVTVHKKLTSYTVTAVVAGNTKTDSFTTTSSEGALYYISMKFGTVILTVADEFIADNSEVTCHNQAGTKTLTPQYAGDAVQKKLTFYVPSTDTWVFSAAVGTSAPISVSVEVTDLDEPVEATLQLRPNGKTVEPTNNIHTWLECAGLGSLPYTTLDEVLEDHDTLAILMTDHNSVDYMVRSKTWIKQISVPTLSADVPEATASSVRSSTYAKYKAFDGNATSEGWIPDASDTNQPWIQYEFDSPIQVTEVYTRGGVTSGATNTYTATILGSNDGFDNDSHELGTVEIKGGSSDIQKYTEINNAECYKYYRVRLETTSTGDYANGNGMKFNFFTDHGITEDETAMRYIGKRNYAADECLDDSDWCDAIVDSDYRDYIINAPLVPTMTSNTAPSGLAFNYTSHSSHQAYEAFDDNNTTFALNNSSSATNQYIGYDFGSEVTKKVYYAYYYTNVYNTGVYSNLRIQGSNDNTNWIDLSDQFTISNTAPFSKIIKINNPDNYRYYRLLCASNNNHWPTNTLQFYGRVDVDESLIDIYSAAQDTVKDVTSGTAVTLCTTDNDGHYAISRTNMPNGEYTLESTVAYDPDGDLSTEMYSKQVKVDANTIEIMLMPDNALYWWGYENGLDNPSIWTGQTATAMTKSTRYYQRNTGYATIGKKSLSTSITKAHSILESSTTGNYDAILEVCNSANKSNFIHDHTTVADTLTHLSVNYSDTLGSPIDIATGAMTGTCKVYSVWYSNPNPLANFFSAAKDTVYYLDNGIQVVVAETDEFGGDKVDFSQIPTGVTLYSSVADDPDSLATTPVKFSKVFNGPNANGKFYLMPEDGDKMLYWYGYIGDDLEVCNSANGWSQSSYTFVDPTFNTNDIQFYAGSPVACAVGTKNAVSGNYKCIFQCISGGNVGELGNFTSKNLSNYTENIRITSTSKTLYALANPVNNGYPIVYTANGRTNKCYAFWGE